MAKRILLPVLPCERFYDSVVAAGDIVAEEGGLITFLFPTVRPPPLVEEKQASNTESEIELPPELGDVDELESWQHEMVEGLDDARDLLYERGIEDEQIDYIFADEGDRPTAQVIADEASAGAYDLVVLSKGYVAHLPDVPGSDPRDLASAVQELAGDGVRLLIT